MAPCGMQGYRNGDFMNRFRNIPAIITLLAGFVGSVAMIYSKYSLVTFLWMLAAVMAGFYIVGLIIRFVLNRAFMALDQKQDDAQESDQDEGTQDGAAVGDGQI